MTIGSKAMVAFAVRIRSRLTKGFGRLIFDGDTADGTVELLDAVTLARVIVNDNSIETITQVVPQSMRRLD